MRTRTGPKSTSNKDIVALLKNDHREVEHLFKQLEKAGPKRRTQLCEKLREELENHAEAEEKIVYQAMREIPGLKDFSLEGFEEHDLMRDLLRKLDGMSSDSERWEPTLKTLKDIFDDHIEEEEDEALPRLQRAIGLRERREMAEAFRNAKMGILERLKKLVA